MNISNQVTMDFIANGLLSLGASPLMCLASEELDDLMQQTAALVINIGTVNESFISLCEHACACANKFNVPIILDPAGAGASHYRKQFCLKLLHTYRIAVVRGNADEIVALGSDAACAKGVDSRSDTSLAVQYANELSNHFNCVVMISGKVDYIIMHNEIEMIDRGSALMPKVTGTGCLLSAIIAAFVGVDQHHFQASKHAAYYYAVCGEKAAAKTNQPGSYKIHFLDALHD